LWRSDDHCAQAFGALSIPRESEPRGAIGRGHVPNLCSRKGGDGDIRMPQPAAILPALGLRLEVALGLVTWKCQSRSVFAKAGVA
jgi:hypothetical protein